MRRSLLFIPSNNPAMLQNADVFCSDAVIFDLEDAVNVTEKDNARNLIHFYLEAHKNLPMEVVLKNKILVRRNIPLRAKVLHGEKFRFVHK